MIHTLNGLTTERIEALLNAAVHTSANIFDIRHDGEYIIIYNSASDDNVRDSFVKHIDRSTIPVMQLISDACEFIFNDVNHVVEGATYGEMISNRVNRKSRSHYEITNTLLNILIERRKTELNKHSEDINGLILELEDKEKQFAHNAHRQPMQPMRQPYGQPMQPPYNQPMQQQPIRRPKPVSCRRQDEDTPNEDVIRVIPNDKASVAVCLDHMMSSVLNHKGDLRSHRPMTNHDRGTHLVLSKILASVFGDELPVDANNITTMLHLTRAYEDVRELTGMVPRIEIVANNDDVATPSDPVPSDIVTLLRDMFATNDKPIYKDLLVLLNDGVKHSDLFEERLNDVWDLIKDQDITDCFDDEFDAYCEQYPLSLYLEYMVAIYIERKAKYHEQVISELNEVLDNRSIDLIVGDKESTLACLDHMTSLVSDDNIRDVSPRPPLLTSVKRSPLYDVALELATVSEDSNFDNAVASMVTLLNKYRTIDGAPVIRLTYGKSTNRYMDKTSPAIRNSASQELNAYFKRFKDGDPMARLLLEFLDRSLTDTPNLSMSLNEVRDLIEDLDITSINDERLDVFKETYPLSVFIDFILAIYKEEKEKKKQKKKDSITSNT